MKTHISNKVEKKLLFNFSPRYYDGWMNGEMVCWMKRKINLIYLFFLFGCCLLVCLLLLIMNFFSKHCYFLSCNHIVFFLFVFLLLLFILASLKACMNIKVWKSRFEKKSSLGSRFPFSTLYIFYRPLKNQRNKILLNTLVDSISSYIYMLLKDLV